MKLKCSNCNLYYEFDDHLLYKVELWKWRFDRGKVYTGSHDNSGAERITLAQHLFGDPGAGFIWEHINRRPLDNHFANLRKATPQQNNWNRDKQNGNFSSTYIGVSWAKERNKWRAQVKCNGFNYHIGYFNSEIEAAKAYDRAVRKYHGEFAVLNF